MRRETSAFTSSLGVRGHVIEKDSPLISQYSGGYGYLLFIHAFQQDLPDIPIIRIEGNASLAAYAAMMCFRLSRLSGSCNACIKRHG